MYEGSIRRLPLDMDDYGGYLQLDGKSGRLGYVAGLRYSHLGISEDGYLTPRAGVTLRVRPGSSLKLLYGEAFRGAGPQEQYYRVAGIIYGAERVGISLKPERIRTYELGLDQSVGKRHSFRINGFYTEVFDLIGRREGTPAETDQLGSAKVYDNLGDQTLYGCEFEVRGYPLSQFSYFANLSYKSGTEGDRELEIEFIEHLTANAGFSWKPLEVLSLAPNAQYVGKREGKDLVGEDISVDGFLLIHLTAALRMGKKTRLSVYIRNIIDEEYAYPEMIRRRGVSTRYGGPMTIPGGAGRSIYAGISRDF
ncbi:MAG: TonB-dependent receptor [Candidatus Latescibacteria bacterium]|nr:TonB-dependent receptor [bacterium]MBD3423543.1 TonB-dependent receptor [Candidatus Latescibacterota bacterium]